jgi:hypothetical protein
MTLRAMGEHSNLYSFDPKAVVKVEPFVEVITRHFRQPAEGLGNDNVGSAHYVAQAC